MTSKISGDIHAELGKHILADGFPLVFDLEASSGSYAVDGRNGDRYLDFFSFFASLPLGYNHPALLTAESRERLLESSIHKVSNSDAYTEAFASGVTAFAELAMPESFKHLFFVEGGTLAVENGLKVAFDWKARKNAAEGKEDRPDLRVLHFREAFHGRSGYTLSLTNTDPTKTLHFPKFDWPRVPNPKICFPLDAAEVERVEKAERETLEAIEAAFEEYPNEIAAIVIEPIQGEGGDNHFRPEFFKALRDIADRQEAMLIFDEVQTGLGLTGKLWAHEHFGVEPDIVAFGKKSQVCGIMVNERVDEVPDNVFQVSSRINSTWGGNLADFVRLEIILRTIHEEGLIENAACVGEKLLDGLKQLSAKHPELITNSRGLGLMCAIDLADGERAGEFIRRAFEEKLIVLSCGERSVRMRPSLTVSEEEVGEALAILERVAGKMA